MPRPRADYAFHSVDCGPPGSATTGGPTGALCEWDGCDEVATCVAHFVNGTGDVRYGGQSLDVCDKHLDPAIRLADQQLDRR